MFRWFENLVIPYPETVPVAPPKGFFAFLWACSEGLRPYILGMTLCTAVIAAFEALLFAMLGRIVDWLSGVEPSRIWVEHRGTLAMLGGILAASVLLVALQTMLKHQTLAANFPMRLWWNFHRLLLGQSMSFYQDEFAGRVATKVMQTPTATK